MSTLKKFAGQTLIYGLSTIIARLFYFILTPLYVSQYPAKTYGIFTTMYAWAAMFNAFLAFGMETTFFRYLQKHEKEKSKVYSNTLFIIILTSTVFITFVLLFAKDIAIWMKNGVYDPDRVLYVKYFAFILVADALCVIPFASLRAAGKPLKFGLIKLANIFIAIAFNLFFILGIPFLMKHHLLFSDWFASWYRQGWIGYVFLANLIASILTFLMLLPELLKISLKIDGRLLLNMLAYSFPVLIANFSFIINENFDKIFLEKLLPPETPDIGIYGAVSKIAIFLSIFINAFRLGAEPFFFSHSKSPNARETYALIMDYFIITMVLIFVGLVCNIEILKYFIKGENLKEQLQYWSGLKIVPVLLMAYLFLGVYMNLSIWYKLSDQTRYGLYISGIGALVTIVLNYIFIPQYSYVASAWITMITYASMMVLSYILGQKNYAIPYHTLKNLLYIGCAIVISWLSFVVFKRNLIIGNGLFVLFMGVAGIVEWKSLRALIRAKQ
ncbi:polysaccharide biosynthesis C-terminal domain-containing protein [Olivibacter ginsenosidimutans]|uniref:Polysaccharide biosynthesis C-terminal domain-containing protein n=1 Tax=Olivibacter ginsenosidimutans TaxID=1176537 RepID=A0ABP9C2J5_9SPHI